MTITQMSAEIQKHGKNAAFVANVITVQHRNRARKLKGLLALLNAGHEVRVAAFDLDVLLVAGNRADWDFLETSVAHFPHHHPTMFGMPVEE